MADSSISSERGIDATGFALVTGAEAEQVLPSVIQSILVRMFVLGYVIVQLAVPLHNLRQPGQVAFTWRMFVPDDAVPRFILHLKSGREIRLNDARQLSHFARRLKPEVDLAQYAPFHLCGTVPDLESIDIVSVDHSDRYRCQ